MSHNLDLGFAGEKIAASILSQKGYQILDHNWRYGKFELDLICEKDGLYVFVEVKTRCSQNHGGPAAAVTDNKKFNLSMAAQAWLLQNNIWNSPCRFDVICVTFTGPRCSTSHYVNAFTPSLDSRDSAW